jgi:hypothetical protein
MKRVLFSLLLSVSLRAAVPAWVSEFSTSAHPAYAAKTKAVVLLSEEKVVAEETGKQITQLRKIIKVLTADGHREAVGFVTYDQKGSKVREAKAYLIYASGKSKEYGKKDFVESELNSGMYLYSTRRYMRIEAGAEADPGSIFAYEYTLEEQTVFSQFTFQPQDDLPHLLSRFQLTVPNGWTAEGTAYNGANAKAEISGATYTWEARDLKPFEREPGAPTMYSQLPRVSVAMLPPGGTAMLSGPVACFRTWKDVSAWKSSLYDPQAEVTAAIEAKAAELTAGKDRLTDKLRSIGEFAQKIRYVAISTNSARGGGYIPHKAEAVLKAAYGDCKDKSNLMRALLKSAGIVSYPVAIFSGNPRFTQEDFPSPHQFNHAIIAISVPADYQAPAAFEDAQLGRLLLFDPTDPYVPLGYIPDHEQNSLALLTAGDKGSLIRTPKTKPEQNRTERRWKMTLDAEGSLQGELDEVSIGQEAFDSRGQTEQLSPANFQKLVEAWISQSIAGATISKLEYAFDPAKNSFRTQIHFQAANYAKIMRGKLWTIRSAPLAFQGTPNVNKAEREQPLIVRPVYFDESIDWNVPASLKLDELPDADSMEAAYGKFKNTWKAGPAQIRVERQLVLESVVLPATDYPKARQFFSRFRGSEAAPIVLLAN